MKLKKENILLDVLLGAGLSLLESVRGRAADRVDDFRIKARDTYDVASDRVSRAADVIRGEDHPAIGSAAAVLIGVAIGVGVGLLLAPASGEETRSNLAEKVQDFSEKVRDRFARETEGATGTYGA